MDASQFNLRKFILGTLEKVEVKGYKKINVLENSIEYGQDLTHKIEEKTIRSKDIFNIYTNSQIHIDIQTIKFYKEKAVISRNTYQMSESPTLFMVGTFVAYDVENKTIFAVGDFVTKSKYLKMDKSDWVRVIENLPKTILKTMRENS